MKKLKKVFNKRNFKNFVSNNRNLLIVITIAILIGITSIVVSYSFFTASASQNVISGLVGDISNPDLNIEFLVENLNTDGTGTDTYTSSYMAPTKGYTYNSTKSSCSVGTLTNNANGTYSIASTGKTKCQIYYDSDGTINYTDDVSINIMKEVRGTNCNGTCGYKKSTDLSVEGLLNQGYTYDSTKSSCTNGATLSYDYATNKMNVSSTSKSVCTAYFKIGSTLASAVLKNNGTAASIKSKGTPDFSKVATTDEGMYAATDDYGTSYYFRGAVSNNWVKFNNMYWRIVRINGNNTVKLVYSGTTAPTEAQKVVMTGTGTQIGTSAFNTNYNSAEYVGYKYTLGDTHGTGTDSTIKTAIDSWYNTNLSSQTSKIADVAYCNDRSTYSGSIGGVTFTGNGIGANTCWYSSPSRMISNSSWTVKTDSNPTLVCFNKSDAFTVSDLVHGNTSLQYPVALLTSDEVAMAGGIYGSVNDKIYLISNFNYWLLSPDNFNGNARNFYFAVNGSLGDDGYVNTVFGLRPVISLNANLETTGDGTWNNPYLIN
jgi:hypothetical protein